MASASRKRASELVVGGEIVARRRERDDIDIEAPLDRLPCAGSTPSIDLEEADDRIDIRVRADARVTPCSMDRSKKTPRAPPDIGGIVNSMRAGRRRP